METRKIVVIITLSTFPELGTVLGALAVLFVQAHQELFCVFFTGEETRV